MASPLRPGSAQPTSTWLSPSDTVGVTGAAGGPAGVSKLEYGLNSVCPAPFLALSRKWYAVPLVRFGQMKVTLPPPAVWLATPDDGGGLTSRVNSVIGVPSLAGAVQFTVTCLSPNCVVGADGALGMMSGTRSADEALQPLLPASLWARTWKR